MDRALDSLASPAGAIALTAAVLWPTVTGYPTWPALSRGRPASTLTMSLAVGWLVFILVQRLTPPTAT